MTPAVSDQLDRQLKAIEVARWRKADFEALVLGETKNITNQRGHWAMKSTPAKEARKAAARALRGAKVPGTIAVVLLTRIGERRLDDDGAIAAMKSVRDGVADGLGINDGINGPVRWLYAQELGYPSVRIEAWGLAPHEGAQVAPGREVPDGRPRQVGPGGATQQSYTEGKRRAESRIKYGPMPASYAPVKR